MVWLRLKIDILKKISFNKNSKLVINDPTQLDRQIYMRLITADNPVFTVLEIVCASVSLARVFNFTP